MTHKAIILSTSYFFATLFAYAAIAKLFTYEDFRNGINQAPFIGRFSGQVAWAVPAVELFTACALLVSAWRLKALYVSAILMALFTLYIIMLLNQHSLTTCDCGGLLEQLDLNTHLWCNIGLLLLTFVAIAMCRKGRAN
jgi:hypothetical protein